MCEERGSDADMYRDLQAEEMFLRFKEANGRIPADANELADWLNQVGTEKPIKPRPGLRLPDRQPDGAA